MNFHEQMSTLCRLEVYAERHNYDLEIDFDIDAYEWVFLGKINGDYIRFRDSGHRSVPQLCAVIDHHMLGDEAAQKLHPS